MSARKARLWLTLRYGLAAVWLANGLLCKLLYLVPRHEAIVARILGTSYAGPLTRIIGVGEVALGLWVLWGRWVKPTAALQIALVLVMNTLEFALALDLLLWGKLNLFFAACFALLIYYYGFRLSGKQQASGF